MPRPPTRACAGPPAIPEVRGGLPILVFVSRTAFERWLDKQVASSRGVWLRFAKRGAEVPGISRQAAIEVALCHGWIDGQLQRYDEHFWLVRFTRRAPKSRWSKINRTTALRLLSEGRMKAGGLAQIEAARSDGRWDAAYAPQSRATVPQDFEAALEANAAAKSFFARLKGANRYAVLYRIEDAKTEKTRRARIDNFVEMLARGEVVHPPRPKAGAKPA